MAVIRLRDQQLSPAHCAKLIQDETIALAADYADGGFERVAASIVDPVEQFSFVAAVNDAPTLFDAVRLIARKERKLSRRRRPDPRERVAEQPKSSLGWL